MKTLIGLPCRNMSHTLFMTSMFGMKRVGEIHLDVKIGSMVIDARNEIAVDAITQGADRILWIDSDMKFKPDMMERMSERIDQGCEMVCGLFFKRVYPTSPVIYKKLEPPITHPDGRKEPQIIPYTDYPKDQLFEVEGCGFGAVMMTMELCKAVWDAYGPAFFPLDWCGEDMSFCYRARQLGRKIWCDSSIKVSHLGDAEYSENTWISQNA